MTPSPFAIADSREATDGAIEELLILIELDNVIARPRTGQKSAPRLAIVQTSACHGCVTETGAGGFASWSFVVRVVHERDPFNTGVPTRRPYE